MQEVLLAKIFKVFAMTEFGSTFRTAIGREPFRFIVIIKKEKGRRKKAPLERQPTE
jgi:hypothetical protein